MAAVWERSKHSGTELLLLLSIADFANDAGEAYPSVATLAAKCRTTARHANRLLAVLRDSGELEIRLNAGPRGSNRYLVTLPPQEAAPLTYTSPLTSTSPLTCTSAPPDVHVPEPLTCTSAEPSLNHHEPSKEKDTPTPRSARGASVDSLFDEFWKFYPKRVGKAAAEKAFAKQKPDRELLDTMIDAIGQQAAGEAWQREGGRFIPHAATWLNAARWQDEVAPAQPQRIAGKPQSFRERDEASVIARTAALSGGLVSANPHGTQVAGFDYIDMESSAQPAALPLCPWEAPGQPFTHAKRAGGSK